MKGKVILQGETSTVMEGNYVVLDSDAAVDEKTWSASTGAGFVSPILVKILSTAATHAHVTGSRLLAYYTILYGSKY